MKPRSYSESTVIDASPEALYDLISDVTRTGQWSPVCTACWWNDGEGPCEGAWFTGRNESKGRVWETQSRVAVARRGDEFTWVVGGSYVRWSYTFLPLDGRTRLTESWEFLPDGIAMFHDKYKDEAQTQIDERTDAARNGIPATLAAIKKVAESPGL